MNFIYEIFSTFQQVILDLSDLFPSQYIFTIGLFLFFFFLLVLPNGLQKIEDTHTYVCYSK